MIENGVVRRIPRAGDVYKYFEKGLYTIIAIAKNRDTEEVIVVYKNLYDNQDIIYAEALEKFMAEVDIMEYPNAKQHYRYEFARGGYIE